MARAFTIRPFNVAKDSKGNEIDFEWIHEQLIGPAIDAAGLAGGTTVEIIESGNIREDMFELIGTADVVVADISIHNANVFYELGIRHALRDKRTVLINNGADGVPFDLLTDRYCAYDVHDPGAAVGALTSVLEATLENEGADSPVFKMIPELIPQDPTRLLAVPRDFRERIWEHQKRKDADALVRMAQEVRNEKPRWGGRGLRLTAEALFSLKSWEHAAEAWEAVRQLDKTDIESNSRLGTIYAKMGDLTKSEQALLRVRERQDATPGQVAELCSLQGSNAKTRWIEEWTDLQGLQARRTRALQSPFLLRSIDAYETGFQQDLNHFYSGLNALGLAVVRVELARSLPDVWEGELDDDDDPEKLLVLADRRRERLEATVEASIEAAKVRMERAGGQNMWLMISEADLKCLTSRKPGFVARLYRQALAGADQQALDAVERQLRIYRRLDIRVRNVDAALEVIEERRTPPRRDGGEP